jgi:hypothetical protein
MVSGLSSFAKHPQKIADLGLKEVPEVFVKIG